MTKTKSTMFPVLLLPLALLAACGGDQPTKDPNQNPPEEPPPERTYCEVTELGCKRQIECGAVVFNHETTEADCVAATRCGDFTKDQLTELGVALDEDAVDACLGAIEALSCAEIASLRNGFGAALAVCNTLTVGTRAEGESCGGLVFDDCAPGYECRFTDTCPGTCVAEVEKCTQDGCAADEYCSYATEQCVEKAALGETCELNLINDVTRRTCVEGTYCGAAENQAPTCLAVIAAGQSCAECLDPDCCETGYYCAPDGEAPQTCVARSAEGESCNFFASCAEGLFCDFTAGSCAQPGALGDACNDSAGACALGLVCDAATSRCAREGLPVVEPVDVLPEGSACARGDVCAIGTTCVDANGKPLLDPEGTGTCERTLGQPGDTCEPSFDAFACAKGLCDFNTNKCPELRTVGEACPVDGLDTSCPLGLCLSGVCAGPDDLSCVASS
ncbi:hypothetical protein L6R52_08810 [Myxococcota bacterium]|nr:hypothetical protein [Myxococcota bacterium]